MKQTTTIGILAHVDAGKTTLSEQLLFRGGALRQPGRVDHRDALLDFDPVERRRGITVFSGQAHFRVGERTFFLLDTPGHADFSAEMERALDALDYAILLVSATEGVQAHTETIWRLLTEHGLPVFFFLNKTDLPGADRERVLAELARVCAAELLPLDEGLTEARREQVALTDEALLEAYLTGTMTEADWQAAVTRLVRERRLFPVYSGSALNGEGVEALLAGLSCFTATAYDPSGPLSGLVYQIRHDNQGNRLALLKLTGGALGPKDLVLGEKVHELRRYQGEKYTTLDRAEAGDLVAVTGLSQVRSGTAFGGAEKWTQPSLTPLLTARALWPEETPLPQVMQALRTLEDEEPALALRWNEELQELHIAVMGPIQLEVLQETAKLRFGLELVFGECQVLYRETLAQPVVGCGHFEPLRHYAEVHLLLEPGPRDSGLVFQSLCSTDRLALNWQRLIETHVHEQDHPGPLTGFPVTDLRISLLSGAASDAHTEGGDFREATYRAIRQGFFRAAEAGQVLLLEPYYAFRALVSPELAGRVMADVRRMQGEVQAPVDLGESSLVWGYGPVSQMMDYARDFAALTKGRGRLQLSFGGYRPCRDQAAVAARIGYDREADRAHPADSVFCSHGAGHLVPWREAPAAMHCPPALSR